jgi:hypothetical protein
MDARRRIAWIGSALTMAVVLASYVWTVNAASGLDAAKGHALTYDYYNHLVHGFLKGHLYLDVEVPAALKALPDPYDPVANRDIGLIDTSYYHGHYYLYFGPAPAVTLMLPFRWLTGIDLPTGWAVLIFSSIGFVTASALWLAIRARYFAGTAAWTGPVGILLLGTGSMVGTVLRRPLFWELAVAAGFAFGLLALAAVYRAIHSRRRAAAGLASAGLFLGLAVASRPTYLFAAPILLVPVWFWFRQHRPANPPPGATTPFGPEDRRNRREGGRLIAAAVLPFAAMMAGVMMYNYARFDRPLEFGHNYQLSVAYESKVRQFSPANALFNLRLYYFLPARWSWQPPFAAPTPTPVAERPPSFYTVDDVYGVLTLLPLAWLALCAPLALVGRPASERRPLGATLFAFALQWLGIGGTMLFFVAAVARYAVDFVPPLMLLAAVGLLAVETRTRSGWLRWPARGVLALATFVSVVGSAVATFELGRTLPQRHPAFMAAVTTTLGHIEAGVDRMAGRRFGPVALSVRFNDIDTPRAEPLFELGDAPQRDSVMVEYLGDRRIRFGVRHGEQPTRWSWPKSIDDARAHSLLVDVGAFYPALEHPFFHAVPYARASSLRHRVVINVDNEPVLDSLGTFYPHTTGTPAAPAKGFTGQVLTLTRIGRIPDVSPAESPPMLVLHVPASDGSAGLRLPLLASGRPGSGDVLFLDWIDASHARLGYDHWGAPLTFSPGFAFASRQPHEIALRQDENRWAPLADGPRLIEARVDGEHVWHATVAAFGCTPERVFPGRNPNGHSTCAPEFPGLTAGSAPPIAGPNGGILLLRVVLPPGVKGAWQPLLTVGHTGATDALSIAYIDESAIQLRFEHRGAPLLLGRRIDLDANPGHDLEIELPSFAAESFGRAANGEIVVRWDGIEALRGPTGAFGFTPEELVCGERPADSTMTEPRFAGAIASREWLPTALPVPAD